MKALNPAPRTNPGQRGMTLVETLVVIGIIGVLAGLLLPAVQSSRESARRAQCGNNLRSLAQAALAFESARGGLPPRVLTAQFPSTTDPSRYQSFSPQVAMLPFLDQSTLFNSLNIGVRCVWLQDLERENATASHVVVSTFLCPSDAHGGTRTPAPNSYRANVGNDPDRWDALHRLNLVEEGAFVLMKPVLPLNEFRDGLSNTLLFSEKPVGSGASGTFDAFRDWIASRAEAATGAEWSSVCANLKIAEPHLPDAGATWALAGAVATHFFTSVPPNSRIPDCGNMNDMGTGVFAARSYHPGGVNASMADGTVHWFSSTTSAEVWRALGTRAGGEVVNWE